MFFSKWPFSDLSKSPEVKLFMPSDSRLGSYYKCSSVSIALSPTETVFFSKWFWSDLPWSPKVKLITPSYSWPIRYYECSPVIIALSLTETLYASNWPYLTFQGHNRSNWLRIRSANLEFMWKYHSYHNAVWHKNNVPQQMAPIWPSKVN